MSLRSVPGKAVISPSEDCSGDISPGFRINCFRVHAVVLRLAWSIASKPRRQLISEYP